MSLVSRFFGSRDDVPEWARFLSLDEFRGFLGDLDLEMHRRELDYELGEGTLRIPGAGGDPREFGLLNLAQLCHASDRAEWPAIIQAHFRNVLEVSEDSKAFDAQAHELSAVLPYLKVRLYPSEYLSQVGSSNVVYRIPAEGLIETLVYDRPGVVQTVSPDTARLWGPPREELFRIGLSNVKAERPWPQLQRVGVGQGSAIDALVGESFFTASHVLFLEEHLGRPTEFGAVVAIPHRHAVLIHSIADLGVIAAVNSLIPIAFGMYQEGPGSLSAALYWWRKGVLTLLPTRVTAQSISFSPPPRFVAEVLDRAPEPNEPGTDGGD